MNFTTQRICPASLAMTVFGRESEAFVPRSDNPVCLNLRCGLQAPPGWINVGGSWNARLVKSPRLQRLLSSFRLLPADNWKYRGARRSSSVEVYAQVLRDHDTEAIDNLEPVLFTLSGS
jgi:hypothetical protein